MRLQVTCSYAAGISPASQTVQKPKGEDILSASLFLNFRPGSAQIEDKLSSVFECDGFSVDRSDGSVPSSARSCHEVFVRPQTGFYEVLCVTLGCVAV